MVDIKVSPDLIRVKKQVYADELVLDSVFKVLPDLYFLMNDKGIILDYRANISDDLYVSPEHFLGKKMQAMLPEKIGLLFEENIQAVLIDSEMMTFEYELELGTGIQQFQARLLKLPESRNIISIIQNITDRINTEQALKNSEAIYRQMFEKNQAIKLIVDPFDGRIVEANTAALSFYGYDHQELQSKFITELNVLSQREIIAETQLAEQENRIFCNFRHKTASGEIKDVEVYSGPITVANKTLIYSIVQDITMKKQVERELLQTELQFRDLFNNIDAAIYIKDLQGRYLSINRYCEKTIRMSESEVKGKTDHDIFPATVADVYRQSDVKSIQLDSTTTTEEMVVQDGVNVFYSTVKFPLKDSMGKSYAFCGISTDITQRKLAEEKILHQAHFDALTKLPNRFLALDRLAQMLNEADRNHDKVAILFLDLDDFKKINDSLGHESGDKLLVESAQRLNHLIRSYDTVGRLGGDEFIVLLRGLDQAGDAQPVVEALLHKFRQPFNIDNRELFLTISVGIAVYPDDADNASTLLRNADAAMYQAKALGRNNYSYFTATMNRDIARRLALEEQIRGALERDEFEVYYQIQIDIKTNKIIGAEALLRWRNLVLGNVSPDEFIPIAEQTGLIVSLGQFVLNEALQTIKQWQQQSGDKLRIAVNLSPRQFRDPELVGFIEQALIAASVAASSLELEITEGVLMSGHAYIDEALASLSKLGIILSMDDFGTGYSSLSYLRTYPFNVLKIDRCFVGGITNDHADKELVNATISMSHALGLSVVAEGVETRQQYKMLQKLGCDIAQGYLFSKPIPKADLFALINKFTKVRFFS